MRHPLSPLTGSRNIKVLASLSSNYLVRAWLENFNLDISSEIKNHQEIQLCLCKDTGLQFFWPNNVSASPSLYAKLSKFSWYYMPVRWEHNKAWEDLCLGDKVLEVGCGHGDFVHRINQGRQASALGLELNESAFLKAQSLGRNVLRSNLGTIARTEKRIFDVVCSFQVLEHTASPTLFIDECLEILRPQGKFIISVPDSSGFLKYDPFNLLNSPPHHMTRWSLKPLKALTDLFPLELHHYNYEPLAKYHATWYVNVQLSRLPDSKLFMNPLKKVLKIALNRILARSSIDQFLRGHTIYACFIKKG